MTQIIVQAPDGTQHIVDVPDPKPPEASADHSLAVAATAPVKGFLHTLNAAGTGMAGMMKDLTSLTAPNGPPNPDEASLMQGGAKRDAAIDSVAAPVPGDLADKYINAAGQAIGQVPFGGPLGPETSTARAAITAALSGVGGEAAAQRFGDTPLNRIVGSLAGGAPVSAAKLALEPAVNPKVNLAKMTRAATAAIPDREVELGLDGLPSAVEQRMAESKAQGLPITTAQGFAQSPGMTKLQATAAASGQAPKTTQLLQQQPQMAAAATQAGIKQLPGQVQPDLDIANQTQQAATDAIQRGYDQAKSAWKQALGPTPATLQDSQVAPFASWLQTFAKANPNSKVGDMALDVLGSIKNPDRNAGQPAAPVFGNISPMNSAPVAKGPKYTLDPLALRQSVEDSLNSQGTGPLRQPRLLDPQTKRGLAAIRTQLDGMFAKTTPELNAANQAYKGVVEQVVNPLKESEVGVLAGRGGAREGTPSSANINSILDAGTTPGSQRSPILSLSSELNASDPTAFPNAVVSNLANKADAATKTTAEQTGDSFARTFYNSVYGTPAQKQGLREQLVGVARAKGLPDNSLYPGFERLVQAVGRTAIRPADVSGASVGDLMRTAGSSPANNLFKLLTLSRERSSGLEQWTAGRTMRALDNLLTSPDGVALLRQLGRTDPMGKVGQASILSYLAGQQQAAAQTPPITNQ